MKRLLFGLLALAGCGPHNPAARYKNPQMMTKAELGDKWPFTIDTVIVHCEGQGIYHVVSSMDGVTYGLNGTSKSSGKYQDIEKIWRKDERYGGSARIDIGLILDVANRNCDKK